MLERCDMLQGCNMLQRCNRYFVQPTIIETSNPKFTTMCSELFGPVLTVHVYDEVCSAVGAVHSAAVQRCIANMQCYCQSGGCNVSLVLQRSRPHSNIAPLLQRSTVGTAQTHPCLSSL
jgi:hypothetical protein